MKILLKNVEIFDEFSEWHNKIANILIDGKTISYIGKEVKNAQKTIDGTGCILTIGWMDTWATFCDPGYEHKEDIDTGRITAAHGGFTKVCLVPNLNPVTQSKNAIKYLIQGNGNHTTDILPIAAVTKNAEGEEMNEMLDLHHFGAVAFSDGFQPLWHTDILLKTLLYLQKPGSFLIQRPEDRWLSGTGSMNEGKMSTKLGVRGKASLSEDIVVERDLSILRYAGGKIHFVNVSSPDALEKIKKAKKEGLNVTCDMAVFQTNYSDEDVENFETNFKVNPPYRTGIINGKIMKYIKDGTIDILSSSHQPHDVESKNLEFDLADFGIISLQTFAAELVKLSKKFGWEYLLPMISTHPRELFGIEVPKIAEGSQAELTLFDPNLSWKLNEKTNASKAINSPHWNREVIGGIRFVTNNGKYHFYEK